MEINKKKSFFWNSSSSDDQLQLDSSHFEKSYQCSFCDRGFSNAQALGGHMNIHRKDRAKLKSFSEKDDDDYDDDQSCYAYVDDINLSNNAGNISSLTYTATSEKQCNLSRRETNPSSSRTADEVNHRVKGPINDDLLKHLPLSLKSQPTTDNRSPADHGNKTASSVDEPFPNLDLELRLGPEPARENNHSSKAIQKYL